ncbi:glycosyltransferase family 39 protein [Roseiconus lacunae]|uniref:ArnT family glycosyltransferase n=1 Tax=Roseiconus lacunae TaxID=2605694 RepID=UPI00308EDC12|nr:glycosyltransferase family 39 protein [Stieleria sp. HD01]
MPKVLGMPLNGPHLDGHSKNAAGGKYLPAVVGVIVALHVSLLAYSAKVHSPTWDEVAHMAAGISHWKLGRFDLYSVNPPFVRLLAAAPVVIAGAPSMDWSGYTPDPAARSEVLIGRRMMHINGESMLHHFFIARLAIVPFSLLGAWASFAWGASLFGRRAGVAALFLWSLSPNVIAYGSLITPDLPSSSMLLTTTLLFWRWVQSPSFGCSCCLSVSLCVAMLVKSVWLALPLLFIGVLALLAIVQSLRCKANHSSRIPCLGRPWRTACVLVACTIVSVLGVNAFYGFQGSFSPLGDYRFSSASFKGGDVQECVDCRGLSNTPPAAKGNRFHNTVLHDAPVPLPANYVYGVDVQTLDFERGLYDPNWKSYLLGEWRQGGWWYYYLLGVLWKVPTGTLLLSLAGIVHLSLSSPSWRQVVGLTSLVVPAFVFFSIVSYSSGLNRYFRYALPSVPTLYILASSIAVPCSRAYASLGRLRLGLGVACSLLTVLSVMGQFPHLLGFFSIVSGGPERSHEKMCDSNVDWGQDLLMLRDWLSLHPDAQQSLNLAYFGNYSPGCLGIDFRLPPALPHCEGANGNPLYSKRRVLLPGWYVVSKNYVAGHPMPIVSPGNPNAIVFGGVNAYRYFSKLVACGQVGTSMNIYQVTAQQAKELALNASVEGDGDHPAIANHQRETQADASHRKKGRLDD